ncbi:hypothetical protein B0T26DRAFT_27774 [Lasiosphaeria miniovina]|uniref:Xylanolytic transcriptional activator regulatory domain-containing protein n=1 Tax=Lasiosphaeria miniovina TaxID=1954250 RepID=A0AA40BG29_9PEZI|nr:uncharacterized protein B0T26DRAFT_27774 [Lasiosphaeria miniovina]KAK0733585.1 hypothetical protein B0T26DRAFT_27774 [Lasiosphaeria miniovina]
MGRPCDYTADAQPPPTADDLAVLQSRLADLENRLSAANNNSNHGTPNTNTNTNASVHNSSARPISPDSGRLIDRPSVNNSRGPQWLPSGRFPSAIFLDIDCFKWASIPIPKPNVDLPADVYEVLSRGNAVQDATAEYFATVHTWFPIISRKRMTLGFSLWEGGPDLAMLFLAIKLVISLPSENTNPDNGARINPLYKASKRFLAMLEDSGILSLLHLQAMILVAVYELGHAIYPAAWITVATCARYADLIGLPSFKDTSVMLGSCTTWTESEERRRVWWAVYILDRVICLGNKKRFSMPEPEDNYLLPVDDRAWDDGDPSRGVAKSIHTPLFQPQGGFARLAQACMLISNVTKHCRDTIQSYRCGAPRPFDLAHVQGLAETLTSFGTIVEEQNDSSINNNSSSTSPSSEPALSSSSSSPSTVSLSPQQQHQQHLKQQHPQHRRHQPLTFDLVAPRCLAFSALVMLLDAYACPENLRDGPGPGGVDAAVPMETDERDMQSQAVTGLQDLSLRVRDLSVELLEAAMLPAGSRQVSPLCLDALYGAMASLHWLWKESGSPEIHAALEDIKHCIHHLALRWRLATEYLELIHNHDVTTLMAWRINS